MSEEIDYSSPEEPFEGSDSDPNYNSNEASTETSEEEQNLVIKRGRKRKRQVNRQKGTKQLKDSGEKYKKYRGSGEEIQKKSIGPPCVCKSLCFEKLSEEERNIIFSKFWDLQNYGMQNAYLYGCIRKNNIKRKTKKRDTRRSTTIEYSIQTNSNSLKICENAFISLHGIGRGRVEYVVSKLKSGIMVPQKDRRGKHGNQKRKYSENEINGVHRYIDSLPRYESHYSRNKNIHKEYMSLDYNIEMLYDRYKENCEKENQAFVSSDKFRRIFTEDYNISFKSPKSDTCAKCDEFQININHAKEMKDTEKLKELETAKELHLRKAEAARNILKQAVEESKINKDVHVITFDLQQALPTPKLTTGPCFYKKKLWCYNFSIHCCNQPEEGYFFLWDESTAKRGSEEIASCLKKYFEKFDIRGDTLYAISDNCCGQNKNWTIVGFWLQLMASGRFKKIIHVFPQVGHTMLPSDRDFALVEKFAKIKTAVYSPDEWKDVLKGAQKKKPFIVTTMKREDFFNFVQLRENFIQTNVGISHCVKLEFNITNPYVMLAYDSYSGMPKPVNLKRKRGRPSISLEEDFSKELTLKYTEALPIDESKLAHVMSCLQWIPPVHHSYYCSLKSH